MQKAKIEYDSNSTPPTINNDFVIKKEDIKKENDIPYETMETSFFCSNIEVDSLNKLNEDQLREMICETRQLFEVKNALGRNQKEFEDYESKYLGVFREISS